MVKPVRKSYSVNEKVTFTVEVAGEGEPLVYLPGIGGVYWDPFLESLTNKYQVIIPYLPGTGESTGLEHIDGMWDLVLNYYELFDEMGLESVNVMGHSFGGMIAAELAATNQDRVTNLVLACPVGLWLDEHPIPDVLSMLPDELLENSFADSESPYIKLLKERANIEDVNEKVEYSIERIKNLNAAGKFMWPIPDRGLKKRIHRIQCPTLIVWGKEDKLIEPVYAQEFNRLIEKSELHIIENASHMVLIEQQQAVLSKVENFLEIKSFVRE